MQHPTRREVMTSVPVAAWLGAGLSGAALAQVSVAPGREGEPEQGPDVRAPGGMPGGGRGDARGSLVQRMLAQAYQNDQYHLPALPYPYDALEPHIDAETMKLHHDRHHQSYVDGLNRAISHEKQLQAGAEIDADRLAGIQRDLSFNAGGHLLHTVFWAVMGSGQDNRPMGQIAEAINAQFGSFDSFRNLFTKVAVGVKGSGWAAMMYEPVGDRLFIYQINEHDAHLAPGAIPLLPLDVWEHAYYLKYGPARAEYVQAWWNVVNWNVVDESFQWMRTRRQEAAIMTAGR
ncbi:MAG TPA: superoxide dismutase [Phycisphaerae bacterium]|nr:superoxide dismutase [Phycisphaerae bacterium]HOJ73926.1 superoxide dismutase [Phycisphaerae bacterium]HOM50867.1 superoxide dismutase [Phycisphaerae bacterium]HON67634.1 superoxide dismutase [Phycisphaerae bacterium]HOQ86367.1 superoxide dismutase [Phycisphaerae bacterium]